MAAITDNLWTYMLVREAGPQYTLATDKHLVTVYKSKSDELYHIAIIRKDTGKRVYESRFDLHFRGSRNPHTIKDVALVMLGRVK